MGNNERKDKRSTKSITGKKKERFKLFKLRKTERVKAGVCKSFRKEKGSNLLAMISAKRWEWMALTVRETEIRCQEQLCNGKEQLD